jgi:S1-C subfamily serine protease
MEPGDVIVSINDERVQNTPGVLDQIAKLEPGATARVMVLRDAKEVPLAVKVGERQPPERS